MQGGNIGHGNAGGGITNVGGNYAPSPNAETAPSKATTSGEWPEIMVCIEGSCVPSGGSRNFTLIIKADSEGSVRC